MANTMNQINHQFQKLESHLEDLYEIIRPLSDAAYHQQPNPTSWSVAQAANHVYLSELLSLSYLRKKLSYPDTIPPFHIKSWGAVALAKAILWSPIKVKAPTNIDMWKDQTILSKTELETKWKALRMELIQFLRQRQPELGTHLVYNHPYAGRMTMHQMLVFLNDHLAHHTRQVKRIIKTIQ